MPHTLLNMQSKEIHLIAIGDLDSDGDNDIIAASTMGHFL